jgi:uncharacterized protein
MTHPNEDGVRAASAAFARGDLSALQSQYFADGVIWHIAGTGPLAGDYEGIPQVMALFGQISALASGPVQPELRDVLVSKDHTVALATIRAERSGKQLQLNLVHVIHTENGKATEIWTHSSDPAGAAEFWA